MIIEKAKRNCACRWKDCKNHHTIKIIKIGEDRVKCEEFYYGFAHPNCALKILNYKINKYIKLKKDFIEKYRDRLIIEEL